MYRVALQVLRNKKFDETCFMKFVLSYSPELSTSAAIYTLSSLQLLISVKVDVH